MESFTCGHPKSPTNLRKDGTRERCRECHNAAINRSYHKRTTRLAHLEAENERLREQLEQCLKGRVA